MNKIAKSLTIMSVAAVLAGGSVFAKTTVRVNHVSTGTSKVALSSLDEEKTVKKAPAKLSAAKTKKKLAKRKKNKKYDDETEEERQERLRRLREQQDPLAK